MKASNKFRATNTFCILSGDAGKIATLVKHYGSGLVSIAHQHVPKASYEQARTYVLRVIEHRDLVDVEVYIDSLDNVIEKERVVVVAAPVLVGPVRPDFTYRVDSLRAWTAEGRAWLNAKMYEYSYNGSERMVAPQYIFAIAKKIQDAGLTISIA